MLVGNDNFQGDKDVQYGGDRPFDEDIGNLD